MAAPTSFTTRSGFDVSCPDGDRIVIQKNGLTVFEVELGGTGMILQTAGDLVIQAGGSVSIRAGGDINLTAGSNVAVTASSNLTMTVGANWTASIGANTNLTTGAALHLVSGHTALLKTHGKLGMQAGNIGIAARNEVYVGTKKFLVKAAADAEIHADGDIALKATKDLSLKGSKIERN